MHTWDVKHIDTATLSVHNPSKKKKKKKSVVVVDDAAAVAVVVVHEHLTVLSMQMNY